MVELKQRLDRVLEKARFTVDVTRPIDLRAEAFGAFSIRSRRESEGELSPQELGELYERSKYGPGTTTTWVSLATHEGGDDATAALTEELRTVLAAFVEPNTDAVGHGLHWIPSRWGLVRGLGSGLQASASRSTVAELAEALVIAGSCLGSERACKYVSAWVEGEPLEYCTLTLLPNVGVAAELNSGRYPHRPPTGLDERASFPHSDGRLWAGAAVSWRRRAVRGYSRKTGAVSTRRPG